MLPEFVWASNSVTDQLRAVHQQRQHVRYAFGGCNDFQMDCSCFVQKAYSDAFSRKLPRSTLSQTRFFGDKLLPRLQDIRRLVPETLCPGDLIYTFRGSRWETASRHVAIYYQHGNILHSARGVGVKIQPLSVLSHHQLHGVVRLFECRGHPTGSASRQRRKPGPSPEVRLPNGSDDAQKKAVRQQIDQFFEAWNRRDRKTFASLWSDGALQWRKNPSSDTSSVLTDWSRTFDELKGSLWIYWIRELQTRGRTTFVEAATEHPCPSARQRGCHKTIQTFVWQLDPDGRWRIVQHEIGSAQ